MSGLIDASSTLFAELHGEHTDDQNPATGDVLATFRLATQEDVAAAAQPAWAATPPDARAEIFYKVAELLEEHTEELIGWHIREGGAPMARAPHEVHATRGEVLAASALLQEPYGQLLPSSYPRLSFARRIPVGVVGVIVPWNAPLILAMRAVAPALALGNAVVLKPDHQTPVFGGLVLGRLFEEAGLPPGLLAVLPGPGEIGAAVVTDPNVTMVSFTGSTRAGREVARAAAETTKKVSLELGGNSPLIVLDDADVEAAAGLGAWGTNLHQGQICLTTSRHLVHESIAADYVAALAAHADKLRVGDPSGDDIQVGPIINAKQADNVQRIVDESVAAGATVRAGGRREGLFYWPTVLDGVTESMPAFSEEIFGPVSPVTIFSDDADAVRLANATEYGLVASIVTKSPNRGLALAERLTAGMVHINDATLQDEPIVPFGGTGASGNGGRAGSLTNWEEFTTYQWVTLRDEPATYPF